MTTMMTLADLLPVTDDTTDWDVAACRGDAHPDRWFPDPSEDFDYAAATGQSGVWGGGEYRRGRIAR